VRYFCYNEYDPESPLADEETSGYVMTKSEDEILYEYYPHWHEQSGQDNIMDGPNTYSSSSKSVFDNSNFGNEDSERSKPKSKFSKDKFKDFK